MIPFLSNELIDESPTFGMAEKITSIFLRKSNDEKLLHCWITETSRNYKVSYDTINLIRKRGTSSAIIKFVSCGDKDSRKEYCAKNIKKFGEFGQDWKEFILVSELLSNHGLKKVKISKSMLQRAMTNDNLNSDRRSVNLNPSTKSKVDRMKSTYNPWHYLSQKAFLWIPRNAWKYSCGRKKFLKNGGKERGITSLHPRKIHIDELKAHDLS